MVEDGAIDLLASRLKTPLQIEQHLTLAFEEAFRVGERPVTRQVVEGVLSRQLDDLEPRLTRQGYTVRSLAEQFNAYCLSEKCSRTAYRCLTVMFPLPHLILPQQYRTKRRRTGDGIASFPVRAPTAATLPASSMIPRRKHGS
jgi:hypothetical protein